VAVWVGRYPTDRYSFEFVAKPGDPEPRLFRMNFYGKDSLTGITQRYNGFAAALAERFGKSTAAYREPVQNALGATFNREIRVWENIHGKIALILFEPNLEYITLRYFIPAYVDYHNQRLDETEAGKGPQL